MWEGNALIEDDFNDTDTLNVMDPKMGITTTALKKELGPHKDNELLDMGLKKIEMGLSING